MTSGELAGSERDREPTGTARRHRTRRGAGHAVRIAVGAVVGAIAGAIASVNIVIFSGIDDGYEATPAQVFDENPLVGVVAATALIVCIVVGVVVGSRIGGTEPDSPHDPAP